MTSPISETATSAGFPEVALAAAIACVALIALQSDYVSRTLLLSPAKLKEKRTSEYNFRWKQALERAVLRFRYAFEKLGGSMVAQEWDTAEEIDSFCDDVLSGEFQDVQVVRVGSEESGPESAKEFSREHFVWLVQGKRLHRIPLAMVATRLADKLERKVTATTLCFVGDASAQQGTKLVTDLATSGCVDDIGVVQEPFWMTCLAVLVRQGVYSSERMERLTFALCRLEALRFKTRTVLFTLPGQSVVSTLLPLLYKVFPDDRHVFCYTGCCNTVAMAAKGRKGPSMTSVPGSIEEALAMNDPTSFTTPLSSMSVSSNVMGESFCKALAKLPVAQADVVETWLTAVDAYLMQKEEDKNYLPYSCKLDFLFDLPIDVDGEKNSSYWALRALLQYLTGTRDEVCSKQMEMARICTLKHESLQMGRKTDVESVACCHQHIVNGNSTKLVDTVVPAAEWSLRQQ